MQNKSFKPAWWLPNCHLQTIWGGLYPRNKNLYLQKERVELPDGDFVDLDWINKDLKKPTILLLPGVDGSTKTSPYTRGMLSTISNQGWRGALMHFRSCSEELNRLPRTHHLGDTKDLENVVKLIKTREPNIPLGAIGFSFGGNVLLKWLGEIANTPPLVAAMAVSVPFSPYENLAPSVGSIKSTYDKYILKSLKLKIKLKLNQQPLPIIVPTLDNIRSVYEFDDKITAPLHGFSSAKDYYSQSECQQYLINIHVPTLLIHAKDDPITAKSLNLQKKELSSHVRFELTDHGGHIGFIGGKFPWRPEYWLEQKAVEFFNPWFN